MIIYKYLPPARVDVLEKRRIRFSQPAELNDPFEFSPTLEAVFSDETIKRFMDEEFDQMLKVELEKYGALAPSVALRLFPDFIASRKRQFPDLLRGLNPRLVEHLKARFTDFFNRSIGALCLSEVRDSQLMWAHYTDNHKGYVIGFDSTDQFFNARRTSSDEFGWLRRVIYVKNRPTITLANSGSEHWFLSKGDQWAYEKEWRILRVLREADEIIPSSSLPVHLFSFNAPVINEVIVGMHASNETKLRLRSAITLFPHAKFLQVKLSPDSYSLVMDSFS